MEAIRADFPIFAHHPHVYLDSAATAHKPRQVIHAISEFYSQSYGSVHRGLYELSARATQAYESARQTVQSFVGAQRAEEIVFTSGTTESINLVAAGLMANRIGPADNIVVTAMEHHANFVPWQQLADRAGAELRILPLDQVGSVKVDGLRQVIDDKTQVVAMVHVSNVLGTTTPVEPLVAAAKSVGAITVLDAAQSAPYLPLDVEELGCDFLAFSGHKLFGPTGIGVLYGRYDLLEQMQPIKFGGEMVRKVSVGETTYKPPPIRFEGGTPHAAGAVGLAAAIGYVLSLGKDRIAGHVHGLGRLFMQRAASAGLHVWCPSHQDRSLVSFSVDDIHPHDVASVLDGAGIAVRAGHHCAQPLMRVLGVPGTVRASFSIYNDVGDLDRLVDAILMTKKMLS